MRESDAREAIEAGRAKERMSEGGRSGKIAVPFKGEARDKVAEAVGMKPRTYAKARAVYKKAGAGSLRACAADCEFLLDRAAFMVYSSVPVV